MIFFFFVGESVVRVGDVRGRALRREAGVAGDCRTVGISRVDAGIVCLRLDCFWRLILSAFSWR